MITIRPAVPADAAAMSAVLTASIRDLCAADHRNDPTILVGLAAQQDAGDGAEDARTPGREVPRRRARRRDRRRRLLDRPRRDRPQLRRAAHRFHGISKTLLAALEERIRQSGAGTARLTSTGTAHRFYLANGWHDAGPAEADRGMLCQPMEKRL